MKRWMIKTSRLYDWRGNPPPLEYFVYEEMSDAEFEYLPHRSWNDDNNVIILVTRHRDIAEWVVNTHNQMVEHA